MEREGGRITFKKKLEELVRVVHDPGEKEKKLEED